LKASGGRTVEVFSTEKIIELDPTPLTVWLSKTPPSVMPQ
jgi:hypothetical protein